MGRLVLKSKHRLACIDATDAQAVARLMGGGMADCVFTSPPYGVGIDYGATYQDTIENLRALLPKLAKVWTIIVAAGGFAVVNFADIVAGRLAADQSDTCEYPMAVEYWPAFRSAGWSLWSVRTWCKPVARVGAPWCASSNRSATNFEHIWTWKRPNEKPLVGRVAQPMDSQSGWFDTSKLEGVDIGKDTFGAGMPVSTAAWMINVHSLVGGIVHESFCGTGTTLIACEQLDRRCMACEISPAYCDVAVARYEAFTNTKAVRWDG